MASERILKRSVFGGFKRENVIDYIEKLQIELAEAQKKAQTSEKKYASLKKRADAFSDAENRLKEQESRINSLVKENDELREKNETYLELISESSSKASMLESEAEGYRAEVQSLMTEAKQIVSGKEITGASAERLEKIINELLPDSGNDEEYDQFRFDDNGLAKLDELYMQNKPAAEEK